jgi:putative lipoic acid-binding regulatory protein
MKESEIEAIKKRCEINFPCKDYPIKIISSKPTDKEYKAILKLVASLDKEHKIEAVESKNNNYVSYRVVACVNKESDLQELFEGLKKIPAVKMVL